RELLRGPVLGRRLHAIGDRLEGGDAHGALLARLQQARNELLPLEALPAAVLLHHHVGDLVDPLVAGEALAAIETLAPAANHFAFLRLARIDDFVAEMAAIRTLHGRAAPWSSFLTARGAPPPLALPRAFALGSSRRR